MVFSFDIAAGIAAVISAGIAAGIAAGISAGIAAGMAAGIAAGIAADCALPQRSLRGLFYPPPTPRFGIGVGASGSAARRRPIAPPPRCRPASRLPPRGRPNYHRAVILRRALRRSLRRAVRRAVRRFCG